jgi:hypothetical protein
MRLGAVSKSSMGALNVIKVLVVLSTLVSVFGQTRVNLGQIKSPAAGTPCVPVAQAANQPVSCVGLDPAAFTIDLSGAKPVLRLVSPTTTVTAPGNTPSATATPLTVKGPQNCAAGTTCTFTASGGAAPYTFSMVPGSVGSITSAGVYTAPAHVTSNQTVNGCTTPANSIFNTRVDSLPVHPNSTLWLSHAPVNGIGIGSNEHTKGNVVTSTDPATPMTFAYSPQANGNFIFVPFANEESEGAGDIPNGYLDSQDNHYLVTYKDTCQQQEIYNRYTYGILAPYDGFPSNSRSGVIYPLNQLSAPGWATDAAGLPISILKFQQEEVVAAENGDLDAFRHAIRMTLDLNSINGNANVWPAQAYASSNCTTNCMPYGTRLRLKSTFVPPPYYGICGTGCQNLIQAIIRQQQRYGLVAADAGSDWDTDGFTGTSLSGDAMWAALWVTSYLKGNLDNYEVVDESSLWTNQTHSGTDLQWMEAKVDNGLITPDNAAVVKATDSAGSSAYFSSSLQGIGVGLMSSVEVAMAGAAPIQFSPWVTGTSNAGYICSMTPNGGVAGTMSAGCLYTPAAASTVTTRQDLTVKVTAAADANSFATFQVIVLPLSSDGKLHIDLGVAGPFMNYTDNSGVVWWHDMPLGKPIALFPDYAETSPAAPTSGANVAVAPSIYANALENGTADMHLRIWVPNGNVAGTVYISSPATTAADQAAFSFDCNGARVVPITDLFTFLGASTNAGELSCTQRVTNGQLHMVVRGQGVGLAPDPGLSNVPIYRAGSTGVLANGITVSVTQ